MSNKDEIFLQMEKFKVFANLQTDLNFLGQNFIVCFIGMA